MENHDNGISCGCLHCQAKNSIINSNKEKSTIKLYLFDFLKVLISTILIIIGFIVKGDTRLIIFIFSGLVCGYHLIYEFLKNLFKGKIFNESTLMIIASLTAFIIGESFEGAFILVLFYLGETLESLATTSSKRKIAGLSKLKSKIVHAYTKDGFIDLKPEDVEIGTLIEIKSGERVAIDGVLIGKPIEVDSKAITGESKLKLISSGENVLSGYINVSSPFMIKTTKLYKDSTVEQIISLVESANSKKAKSQKFITSFAKIYTPLVFIFALILAVIFPLFDGYNFTKWIYKSLSFLVVSCPCALVISVPLAYFISIGSFAKRGILVKGSSVLDNFKNLKTIVFDKTGTITKGEFEIDEIKILDKNNEDYIKELVCAIENKSNHPISKIISKNFNLNKKLIVDNVDEIVGKGIVGTADGKLVLIGNEKLMRENKIDYIKENYVGTVLYLAISGEFVGAILLKDKIKLGVKDAIFNFRKNNIENFYMLSGDSTNIAKEIGNEVGINKIFAELLPNEKLELFNKIKNENFGKIMYVGDGINDSPTLVSADVGVAMGKMGNEIAIDSADVVIMNDDVNKINHLIKFAKRTNLAVQINIFGSLIVKFLIMLLGVLINLPIWVAMIGDVGVMLLAVINSLMLSK